MTYTYRSLFVGLCLSTSIAASTGTAQAQDCKDELRILSRQTDRAAIQSSRLDVMICFAQLYHITANARPFAPTDPAKSYFALSLGDPVTLTARDVSDVSAGASAVASHDTGSVGVGVGVGVFNDGSTTYACAQQFQQSLRIGMAEFVPNFATPAPTQIILKAAPNLNAEQLKYAQGAVPVIKQVLSAQAWKPEYRSSDLGLQEITNSTLASGKFNGFVTAKAVRFDPCDTAPGSAAANPGRLIVETDLMPTLQD